LTLRVEAPSSLGSEHFKSRHRVHPHFGGFLHFDQEIIGNSRFMRNGWKQRLLATCKRNPAQIVAVIARMTFSGNSHSRKFFSKQAKSMSTFARRFRLIRQRIIEWAFPSLNP
jgi:hypothetical protein